MEDMRKQSKGKKRRRTTTAARTTTRTMKSTRTRRRTKLTKRKACSFIIILIIIFVVVVFYLFPAKSELTSTGKVKLPCTKPRAPLPRAVAGGGGSQAADARARDSDRGGHTVQRGGLAPAGLVWEAVVKTQGRALPGPLRQRDGGGAAVRRPRQATQRAQLPRPRRRRQGLCVAATAAKEFASKFSDYEDTDDEDDEEMLWRRQRQSRARTILLPQKELTQPRRTTTREG